MTTRTCTPANSVGVYITWPKGPRAHIPLPVCVCGCVCVCVCIHEECCCTAAPRVRPAATISGQTLVHHPEIGPHRAPEKLASTRPVFRGFWASG